MFDLILANSESNLRRMVLADDTCIALPVRFNPFKHHRNYILSILDSAPAEAIITLLDPVCNNYIDIYTGTMAPETIVNGVIQILKSKQVYELADFTRWVASKNGYRQIQLEDGSEWVLRKGDEAERYIHIHPSREGSITIRFKGSTLKTIWLLKAICKNSEEIPSPEKVNLIRMQIGLSPIKRLDRNKGILKCYTSFFNNMNPNQI